MKKIIPRLFRFLLLFIIFFIWCRYYISDIYLTLASSLSLTFVFDLILNFFSKRKEGKNSLKNEEIKKAENYCNKFIFSEANYTINFYFNLAKKRHNAKKINEGILIEHESSKILLYPHYTLTNFNANDFVKAYNIAIKNNVTKLVICTNEFDKNINALAKSLKINIVLLNKFNAYKKLMKEYNTFPEELELKEPKTTFKSLLEYSLNKKRMKGYLFSAFILLLSSFFIRLNIYYLVMSTFLIILALFCQFNTKFNNKIPDEILN